MHKGYIYGLVCPYDKMIKYVGQTAKTLKFRLECHKKDLNHALRYPNETKTRKVRWFLKLHRLNLIKQLTIVELETCELYEIDQAEEYWIYYYRLANGSKMTNHKNGGNQSRGHNLRPRTEAEKVIHSQRSKEMWIAHENDIEWHANRKKQREETCIERYGQLRKPTSDETRKLMSDRMKGAYIGNKNPFYGRKHSEVSKQKFRESKRTYEGTENPFYGKTHDEQTRAIIKEARSKQIIKSKPLVLYREDKFVRFFVHMDDAVKYFNHEISKRNLYSHIQFKTVFRSCQLLPVSSPECRAYLDILSRVRILG